MRIWQGSLFSSPVFLSHHLFGCARIHWNVFTRCQNSGNSTGFGSRERKNKVITGGVWEREPGGVSVTITEETIYSMRESKVSVPFLRNDFWSGLRNGCHADSLLLQWKQHHVILQTASEPFMYPASMLSERKTNAGWGCAGLRNSSEAQIHFCDVLGIQLVFKSFER